ncbi:MAG: Cobyrinic acid a,c-diamide synthase [Segetibacter sp.]|jgi:chromosome partitioning protein|nr:Cobyrinic acid a,c-diamide synthase [Segetibacter sp.]
MTVYAFYNQKGGVGKTAATVNLAFLSAQEGWRTLLWDLDPQGAAGFYFQVDAAVKNGAKKLLASEMELSAAIQPSGYENLDIIPSDLSARNAEVILSEIKQGKRHIKAALNSIKNDYDIIIIDCPPGLSVLHDNVFHAADFILVPNIPTTLSMRSYETILDYFGQNKLDVSKIKSFFSMVDHRKNLHHEVLNDNHKNKTFLRNYIPYLSDVEKMGQQLAPVGSFAGSSYAAQCYRDLWKEVKKLTLA